MANFNDQLLRMKSLMTYGAVNEKKETNSGAMEYHAVGADGKSYGIIRENQKFYIKVAPKSKEMVAEAYDYIGGFNNKKAYEYTSYSNALKNFELKMMSIKEAHNPRLNIETLSSFEPDGEVMTNSTKEMMAEIARQRQIMNNVAAIMNESTTISVKNVGVPEAPKTVKFNDKIGKPFDETAKAELDNDFKKTSDNPEKQGAPFGDSAKAENEKDAEYVPSGSVANQKPKGGKVVKVNESTKKMFEIMSKLDKTFTLNESCDEWGSCGIPSSEGVGSPEGHLMEDENIAGIADDNFEDIDVEDSDVELDGEMIDSEDDMDEDDFDSEDDMDFDFEDDEFDAEDDMSEDEFDTEEDMDFDFEEDEFDAEDDMDMEVENDELAALRDEIEALRAEIATLKGEENEIMDAENDEFDAEDDMPEDEFEEDDFDTEDEMPEEEFEEDEFDAEDEMPEDEFDAEDEMDEEFNPEIDANYDDFDESSLDEYDEEMPEDEFGISESRKKELLPIIENLVKTIKNKKLNEEGTKLNDFGKHPGYRKKPMTLPQTGSDKEGENKDWNDESVYSEQPFGNQIGDSAPYEKLVQSITNSVMEAISGKKKI